MKTREERWINVLDNIICEEDLIVIQKNEKDLIELRDFIAELKGIQTIFNKIMREEYLLLEPFSKTRPHVQLSELRDKVCKRMDLRPDEFDRRHLAMITTEWKPLNGVIYVKPHDKKEEKIKEKC